MNGAEVSKTERAKKYEMRDIFDSWKRDQSCKKVTSSPC